MDNVVAKPFISLFKDDRTRGKEKKLLCEQFLQGFEISRAFSHAKQVK